jgi:uncharacterized protein (TIGR03437 family)
VNVPASTAQGYRDDFTVTASNSQCVRTPTVNVPWVTLTCGQTGRGNGTVCYAVENNLTPLTRTGLITVGNAAFTITQQAATCRVTLTLGGSGSVPATGGTRELRIETTCEWTVTTGADWLAANPASGRGNATVQLTLTANPAAQARAAAVNVLGTSVTVNQAGQACTYTISASSLDLPAAGGPGSIRVTPAGIGCEWTATSSAPWLRVTKTTTGVDYVADANPGALRLGTLTIAGTGVAVRQAGQSGPRFTAAGVVNGASFQAGAVAPGEMVTIFGEQMGPAVIREAELTADRTGIVTDLGSARVLFDGVAAPMIHTVAGQVTAIAPYALSGRMQTQIQVEYQGARSAAAAVRVVSASPALFTADTSGKGQGAVLNQDRSANSAGNPARVGEALLLFGTGFGLLSPALRDGALAPSAEPLPRVVLPVRVIIGGTPARVLYAGAAPGFAAGLEQINVLIEPGTPEGEAVPIEISAGEANGPSGVTVAVSKQ